MRGPASPACASAPSRAAGSCSRSCCGPSNVPHGRACLLAVRRRRPDSRVAQLRPGAGLVDQVDRLVREEPVGDVAAALVDRRLDGLRRVHHVVERLVAVLDAHQDVDGAGLVGRLHLDGLEPPLERPVLLDVLPVLRGRGRADAADLAPRQGRLQDVGGVERPFRRAGAHQRVQLVDEHDDVLVLDQLLHDGFEPLFELPPVLRARHHERDVERDDALVGEVARYASGDDPLGQPFDNRGLADTGLADEDRVVLRPPAEHLLNALHLVLAADQRVERLPRGGLGQVAAELREQRRVLGPGRRGGLLVEQRHHVLADRIQPQPLLRSGWTPPASAPRAGGRAAGARCRCRCAGAGRPPRRRTAGRAWSPC